MKSKKIFPKLKQKLKGFLTDESGKITKRDALGVVVGASLISGVSDVSGGHSNVWTSEGDYDWWGNPVCSHTSGVINGHLSQTPSVTGGHHEGQKALYTGHSSHSSHGSHGSGGWC